MTILETLQAELEELKLMAQAIRDRSDDLRKQVEANDEKLEPIESKINDKVLTIQMIVQAKTEADEEEAFLSEVRREAFATMFVKSEAGGVTKSDLIEFARTAGIEFDDPDDDFETRKLGADEEFVAVSTE